MSSEVGFYIYAAVHVMTAITAGEDALRYYKMFERQQSRDGGWQNEFTGALLGIAGVSALNSGWMARLIWRGLNTRSIHAPEAFFWDAGLLLFYLLLLWSSWRVDLGYGMLRMGRCTIWRLGFASAIMGMLVYLSVIVEG